MFRVTQPIDFLVKATDLIIYSKTVITHVLLLDLFENTVNPDQQASDKAI